MLEHYGFENVRSNGHTIYRHRDYPDLLFPIPHQSGEVKRAYAMESAKLCMEVKRRNAEGRCGTYTEIPAWAKDVFSDGTRIEHSNNSMTYEHGAILDMDQVKPASARIYQVMLQGSSLTVHSADFPNHEMHFTIREGDRHREQGLRQTFARFDHEVANHVTDINSAFAARLHRAVENRGFQCSEETLPKGGKRLHLQHPIYRLEYWLDVPPPGRPVNPVAIKELERAFQHHDERFYAQMDVIDSMTQGGWTHSHSKATNGTPGTLMFKHAAKELAFDVPTHGQLEMFDGEMVESIAASLERNPERLPQTVRETIYYPHRASRER